MKQTYFLGLFVATLLGFASSCKEVDPPYPDNTVNFSASTLGFAESDSVKTFTVDLDYAQTHDVTVTIGVTATGVVYGTDFSVSPAATNNVITATIEAGNTADTITVTKLAEFLEGSESIRFTILSVSGTASYGPLAIGSTDSLGLSFSAIVSDGASMSLQGGAGGSNAANSVFVDFSNNEQSSVARISWNLGFYCGDTFSVKLNNTLQTMAMATDLSIGDVVSKTDSSKYVSELTLNYSDKFAYLDDLSGDVSKVIIKEKGKVYLVNCPELTPQLYKVRVTQADDNTYTLQYAPSYSSDVKTIEIAKNSNYNYVYVSFTTNNTVTLEPEAAKWDIQWTKAIYKTLLTDGVTYIPYLFSDLVFINSKAGVQVAQVLTSVTSYADFKIADIESIAFSSDVDAIGSNWRNTISSKDDSRLGIFNDRFYVIKDPAGNVYKLRFLKMGVNSDGGTRGYPQIEYALVK